MSRRDPRCDMDGVQGHKQRSCSRRMVVPTQVEVVVLEVIESRIAKYHTYRNRNYTRKRTQYIFYFLHSYVFQTKSQIWVRLQVIGTFYDKKGKQLYFTYLIRSEKNVPKNLSRCIKLNIRPYFSRKLSQESLDKTRHDDVSLVWVL